MPHVRIMTGLDGFKVRMQDRDTFDLIPTTYIAEMGVTKGTTDLSASTPTTTVSGFGTQSGTLNDAAENTRRAFAIAEPLIQKAHDGDANALRDLLKLNPMFWNFAFVQEAAKKLMTRGASCSPKMGRPKGIGHLPDGTPLNHVALIMLVQLAASKEGSLDAAFDKVGAHINCSREHVRTTFFKERKKMRDDPFLKPMIFDTAPGFRVGLKEYERIIGKTILPLKDFVVTTEKGVTTKYYGGHLALVSPDNIRLLPRRAFRFATRGEIRKYWKA